MGTVEYSASMTGAKELIERMRERTSLRSSALMRSILFRMILSANATCPKRSIEDVEGQLDNVISAAAATPSSSCWEGRGKVAGWAHEKQPPAAHLLDGFVLHAFGLHLVQVLKDVLGIDNCDFRGQAAVSQARVRGGDGCAAGGPTQQPARRGVALLLLLRHTENDQASLAQNAHR